jgi:predicted phosphodiesterase
LQIRGDQLKIAAISDIHGNLGALEAVLVDIGRSSVDTIVNLGDILSGPLFPEECADRLLPLGISTIRGNHERQLLTLQRNQMGESDRYTAECLSTDHHSWMAQLPESLWIEDDVLLVHGTPNSDVSYFLETVDASGVRPASPMEIRNRAGMTSAALILHGHSHIPRIFKVAEGPLIVNPGSVGLPAYQDDLPFPHKMETGSPHARYAIVEKRDGSWSAELKAVLYDWEGAAAAAERRRRPDWARALRSGRA